MTSSGSRRGSLLGFRKKKALARESPKKVPASLGLLRRAERPEAKRGRRT
jgi:hypothetical protein